MGHNMVPNVKKLKNILNSSLELELFIIFDVVRLNYKLNILS